MQIADDGVTALIAQYAKVTIEPNDYLRVTRKCELLDRLGEAAPCSDAALALLAEALADEDVCDTGGSPYNSWYEIVAEHAYRALSPVVARAETLIVAQLEQSLRRDDDAIRRHGATLSQRVLSQTGLRCRQYGALLLERLPALSPAAIEALTRCASDPAHEVQQAVGLALRGRIDVNALLAKPETRLVGVIASPPLPASQIVELLRDETGYVRLEALRRLRDIDPTPVAAAIPLIECLNHWHDEVAHRAADALEGLALDDRSVTEALFEAGRKAGDRRSRYLPMRVLARRPAAHLARLMPDLLAWFLSSEDDHAELAAALDAVSDQVPLDVERVLKEQLASPSRDPRQLRAVLHALRSLGRMARLVRPQIEVMTWHPDAAVRSAAATLVSKLQL